jgi:hypothetical protein
MIRKWFLQWQTRKAFEALYIVCGEYEQHSDEYKQIVTALDILRSRMS